MHACLGSLLRWDCACCQYQACQRLHLGEDFLRILGASGKRRARLSLSFDGFSAELGRCWRVNVNRSTPPQFCCAFKRTSEVIAHSVGSESPPPSGVDA